MRSFGTAATFALVVCIARMPCLAQDGPGYWGAKERPLSVVVKRADYRLYVPDPGDTDCVLQRCQVVWVPRLPRIVPELPGRLAVCVWVWFRGHRVAVIQMKHIRGQLAGWNVMWPKAGGFFYSSGSPRRRRLYQIGQTDLIAVSNTAAMGDLEDILITRLRPAPRVVRDTRRAPGNAVGSHVRRKTVMSDLCSD